tara:strand:- start:1821 stop:1940 length:120 start_codon:yes stop_codon:yes gene_type:complete
MSTEEILKENNEMLKEICSKLDVATNKTSDQPNPNHEEK